MVNFFSRFYWSLARVEKVECNLFMSRLKNHLIRQMAWMGRKAWVEKLKHISSCLLWVEKPRCKRSRSMGWSSSTITSVTGPWHSAGWGACMKFPAVSKQEIWLKIPYHQQNGLLEYIQKSPREGLGFEAQIKLYLWNISEVFLVFLVVVILWYDVCWLWIANLP